jgi:hypothetical protein
MNCMCGDAVLNEWMVALRDQGHKVVGPRACTIACLGFLAFGAIVVNTAEAPYEHAANRRGVLPPRRRATSLVGWLVVVLVGAGVLGLVSVNTSTPSSPPTVAPRRRSPPGLLRLDQTGLTEDQVLGTP